MENGESAPRGQRSCCNRSMRPFTLAFKTRLSAKPVWCMRITNHFHVNGFALSLALLKGFCFSFLLGITVVPREIEDNSHAKILGGKQGLLWGCANCKWPVACGGGQVKSWIIERWSTYRSRRSSNHFVSVFLNFHT